MALAPCLYYTCTHTKHINHLHEDSVGVEMLPYIQESIVHIVDIKSLQVLTCAFILLLA